MLWVRFPPGPLLETDKGVLLGEQCGSNPHREGSNPSVLAVRGDWALASPPGCNPGAFAVQVQLLLVTLFPGRASARWWLIPTARQVRHLWSGTVRRPH